MKYFTRSALLGTFWLFHLAVAQSTCYNDEGVTLKDANISTADQFRPCNQASNQPSPCCILNRTNPDTCLLNGLCMWYPNPNNKATVQYYRNFCSDPNQKGCLPKSICPKTDQKSGIQLTPCGSSWNVTTKWCCGADNSCCANDNDPNAVTIPLDLAAAATATSTSSTSASTGAPSQTTSAPQSTTTTPAAGASSSGMSKGAIAGIAVGAAAGGIALLVLLFLLVTRSLRKRREAERQPEASMHRYEVSPNEKLPQYSPGEHGQQYYHQQPPPPHQQQQPPSQRHELPEDRPLAELQ